MGSVSELKRLTAGRVEEVDEEEEEVRRQVFVKCAARSISDEEEDHEGT